MYMARPSTDSWNWSEKQLEIPRKIVLGNKFLELLLTGTYNIWDFDGTNYRIVPIILPPVSRSHVAILTYLSDNKLPISKLPLMYFYCYFVYHLSKNKLTKKTLRLFLLPLKWFEGERAYVFWELSTA